MGVYSLTSSQFLFGKAKNPDCPRWAVPFWGEAPPGPLNAALLWVTSGHMTLLFQCQEGSLPGPWRSQDLIQGMLSPPPCPSPSPEISLLLLSRPLLSPSQTVSVGQLQPPCSQLLRPAPSGCQQLTSTPDKQGWERLASRPADTGAAGSPEGRFMRLTQV